VAGRDQARHHPVDFIRVCLLRNNAPQALTSRRGIPLRGRSPAHSERFRRLMLAPCLGGSVSRLLPVPSDLMETYGEMDDVSDLVLQFTEANRRWVAAPAESTTLGRESFTTTVR